MKKTMRFLSMAALALVGAVMTGCSSDDNIVNAPQPKKNVITVTTTVSLVDSTTTRALTSGGTKAFVAGETLSVKYEKDDNTYAKAESAPLFAGNITNAGKTATFTFTLDNPKSDGHVSYVYPAAMADANGDVDYTKLNTQDGTLASLAANLDLATSDGAMTGTTLPDLSLVNQLAICAFTLKNNSATPAEITNTITGMTISDGTNSYTVNRSAADGPIYVAIRPTSDVNMNYVANSNTNYYEKTTSSKTYTAGHLYQLGLRMATSNVINLSALGADYVAQDGNVLTNTLGGNYKISIADGATVMLSDATINGVNERDAYNNPLYLWSGITCLGDATIILKDGTTNTVKGFNIFYPGVFVPEGSTLTIQGETAGTGSLDASSNGGSAGIGGGYGSRCGNITINGGTVTATGGSGSAGIGSGQDGASCGDITINGGTVTATGGSYAAGIGSGSGLMGAASCGNITINGGTVTATGGDSAAGIGSGQEDASCGDITIGNTVTRVTATKGTDAPNSIGAGKLGTCGTVTIGGWVIGNIITSPYTYPSGPPLTLTSPAVGQVIGNDGKNYAYASLPVGVTAVAMLCYISGDHGLALALTDEASTMNWSTAMLTCAAHTPAFFNGIWKLPSQDEWKQIFAAGPESSQTSSVALNTAIVAAGGNALQKELSSYWSSSEHDGESVYGVTLTHDIALFSSAGHLKDHANHARACLAW